MDNKENLLNVVIQDILNIKLTALFKDEIYVTVKKSLICKLKSFAAADEIKNILYKYAEKKFSKLESEGKGLKDIFPGSLQNSIKVLVYNKSPEIKHGIENFLKDEKFKVKIKAEINKLLSGMNPMVSKFINVENMYSKFTLGISSYLDNTENMMNLIMHINNKTDEIFKMDIAAFTSYMPYEGKLSFIKVFVDSAVDFFIEDALLQSLIDKIEREALKYESVGNLLESMGVEKRTLYR